MSSYAVICFRVLPELRWQGFVPNPTPVPLGGCHAQSGDVARVKRPGSPGPTGVIFNDTKLSYVQLNGAANQLANGLRKLGVQRGDKEMVIRGGFNVYPRELEEYFMTHPKVSLVAVKGVPDPKLGEEIKAYIVLKPGQSATVDEMLDFALEGLAAYKYPRYIEFRTALPMTATGKILKRELVDEE